MMRSNSPSKYEALSDYHVSRLQSFRNTVTSKCNQAFLKLKGCFNGHEVLVATPSPRALVSVCAHRQDDVFTSSQSTMMRGHVGHYYPTSHFEKTPLKH